MKSTNDSSLLSPASRGGRRLALPKHHSLRFTGITSCARKVHEPRKNGTRRSGVPAERLPTDARARKAEQGTATAPGTRLQRPGSARQERKNLSAKAAGVSLPAGSIALETKTLPKKNHSNVFTSSENKTLAARKRSQHLARKPVPGAAATHPSSPRCPPG